MMKLRWGDADDDEDVLPEGTTTGPNDKGILTKTEYFHNPKGEAIKKTTKIQLVNVTTRVYEVRRQAGGLRGASAQHTVARPAHAPPRALHLQRAGTVLVRRLVWLTRAFTAWRAQPSQLASSPGAFDRPEPSAPVQSA